MKIYAKMVIILGLLLSPWHWVYCYRIITSNWYQMLTSVCEILEWDYCVGAAADNDSMRAPLVKTECKDDQLCFVNTAPQTEMKLHQIACNLIQNCSQVIVQMLCMIDWRHGQHASNRIKLWLKFYEGTLELVAYHDGGCAGTKVVWI